MRNRNYQIVFPFRKSNKKQIAKFILRLIMGGIFLYAAWDKMAHTDQFAEVIMNYEILPNKYINLAAIWLAALEVLIGLMIVLGIWVRANAFLMSVLMLIFIAGIASALYRGIDLTCGCFSTTPDEQGRSWISLWQEVLILAGSLALWIVHWNNR
ncbi:MAG: MauE/DoxX family redox-associated membrane protein [Bacteroidota bacterium]